MNHPLAKATEDRLLKGLGLGQAHDPFMAKAREQLLLGGYAVTDDLQRLLATSLRNGSADVVSKRTGCVWMNHGLPEIPPGYIRPGKLRVGDRVQVVNWVPLGVHGAMLDLGPRNGKVNKIVMIKCRISCGPMAFDRWPSEEPATLEEKRVYALGLEDQNGTYPVLLKDYSFVMRLDGPAALPTGESRVYY